MSRTVGKPVREGRVVREAWLPLVRQLRPRGERGVVMREGLVRAGRRDLGAHGAVQRSDHAREVLRVEQRVAPGGDRAYSGRRHRLRGAGPGHDERIGHHETAEVERVPQVAQNDGREARRSPRGIPVRVATNALITLPTPARMAYSNGATSTCWRSVRAARTRGRVACESWVVRPWPG